MVMEKTTESECTKKGTGKDLFSWLVAMRSALQDFLVLHDLVGEGATRFGFDGRLGGMRMGVGIGGGLDGGAALSGYCGLDISRV
jgi:hypothetical protein